MTEPDKPLTLLLTGWISHLIQRLEGFRDPSAMFGRHQRSAKRLVESLTPKTFENLSYEQLIPSEEAITKIKKYRLSAIRERGAIGPYSESFEELAARITRTSAPTGLASTLFGELPDQRDGSLPNTHRMAKELDALSNVLLSQQLDGKGGSLEGYKQALLDSHLVPPEYWIEPGHNYDLRPLFEQATDWQTAWKITHLVIFQQQIALLALWDVEYCADMFEGVLAIPLFLQLAPRSRARAETQAGGLRRINTRKANVIDTPFAQLIDLVWCVIRRLQEGSWPLRFPTDAEMSETLNKFTGKLADYRVGRPNLTMARFEALWPKDILNNDDELVAPPITLLAVAHTWNLINPKPPLIPVDQCYMRAWYRSRRKLGFKSGDAVILNGGWPEFLDRGLDYPAPD